MKQKGFAPLIIILVLAILGVVGYFGYKNVLSKSVSLVQVSSSAVIADLPKELGNVPVYPNSTFDTKYGKSEGYSTGRDDQILRKFITFTFGTQANTQDIFNWYKNSNLASWKFTPTKTTTTNGTYQNSYYGSVLSDGIDTYLVDILPSYQGGFGNTHSVVFTKEGDAFDWQPANSADTAGWVTFLSKDGSVSFKHPKDLFVKEGTSVYGTPLPTFQGGGVASGISLQIFPNPNNSTSEEYVIENNGLDKIEWQGSSFQGEIVKNKPTYLKDFDITIVDDLTGAGTPGPNVYISKDGKIYFFQTDGVGVEQLNKVLSTIKFTQ